MLYKVSLSQRTHALKPSATLALAAQAKALKDAGKRVIAFAAGEPDFDTPEHIKKAAVTALENGDTKYTAVNGTPALRNAIVEKFKRDNNFTFKPDEVMATCGGKQAVYNALTCLVDPEDEVLIPVPYWVSYPDMVKVNGGVPVFVNPNSHSYTTKITAEDIEKKITAKSKVLIINSPNNPTGLAFDHQELKAIVQLAIEKNLFLISDEIYEKLVYHQFKFTSIAQFFSEFPQLQCCSLITHGVAKTYSMTGWRIGYCAGPATLIQAMSNLQGASTSNPTSFAQAGAVAALTGSQDCVENMRRIFENRLNLMLDLFSQIPEIEVLQPQGAFYLFVNVKKILSQKKYGTTDIELSRHLLEQHGLAMVPGTEFGAPGHLRLSFATSDENIKEGLHILKQALGG